MALGGINVWSQEWRWIGAEVVYLPNPLDPDDRCRCMICEIGSSARPTRFAAAELPSGLWAFFVPN
jgi:hypothetical protein